MRERNCEKCFKGAKKGPKKVSTVHMISTDNGIRFHGNDNMRNAIKLGAGVEAGGEQNSFNLSRWLT